ncbi:hypothetical protein [Acinetobacter junii]|nr:hypothetical protein [Acinetobacter junii]
MKIISLKKPLQIGLCNKADLNYTTPKNLVPTKQVAKVEAAAH